MIQVGADPVRAVLARRHLQAQGVTTHRARAIVRKNLVHRPGNNARRATMGRRISTSSGATSTGV